ncbi:MAG: hypothetical protein V1720_01985 [bacterium]
MNNPINYFDPNGLYTVSKGNTGYAFFSPYNAMQGMIGEFFAPFRFVQNDVCDNTIDILLQTGKDYIYNKAVKMIGAFSDGFSNFLERGKFTLDLAKYAEHKEREDWETQAFAMVLRENSDLVKKGYFDKDNNSQQSNKPGDFTLRFTDKLLIQSDLKPEVATATVMGLLDAKLKELNPTLYKKYGYDKKEENNQPARIEHKWSGTKW